MLESERANIIAQLKDAYASELPDVDASDKTSIFDSATNTVVCIGDMSVEEFEIREAIEYFKDASNRFIGNPDPGIAKKGKYCMLAATALINMSNK